MGASHHLRSSTALGDDEVRLLSQVSYIDTSGMQSFFDSFTTAEIQSWWSTPSWSSLINPTPWRDDYIKASAGTSTGLVLAQQDYDNGANKPYMAEIFIVPCEGAHHGTYRIWAELDNASPNGLTGSWEFVLTLSGSTGAYTYSLIENTAGPTATVRASGNGTIGSCDGAWMQLYRSASGGGWYGYWSEVELFANITTGSAGPGERTAIGMVAATTGDCIIGKYRLQFYQGSLSRTRTKLVTAVNGIVYDEDFLGLVRGGISTSSITRVGSDRYIQCAERAQILYIADWSENIASGTDGVVSGGGGDTFDSATYSDWTTLGIDKNKDMLLITSGPSVGLHTITAVSSGTLTIAGVVATGTGNTFVITRYPKKFNPLTRDLSPWHGTPLNGSTNHTPYGCKCVGVFNDRMVLTGDVNNPGNVYMSRIGDPNDWDTGAADDGGAFAFTPSNRGAISQPVLAYIEGGVDYGIIGCRRSMWILRGDPKFGGRFDNVSHTTGIVSSKAWCYGPEDQIIFLSNNGLCLLPLGGPPVPISAPILPRELKNTDPNAFEVMLEYDAEDRGVWIYLTPTSGVSPRNFWFDWETKTLWPVVIPAGFQPTAIHAYETGGAEESGVVVGGRSGYLRRFNKDYVTDDGTEIVSSVLYGPIRLGIGDSYEGLITEIIGVSGMNSGPIDWEILVGETIEQAFRSTAVASGTWQEGYNYTEHPRAVGAALFVRLTNGAVSRPWAMEGITINRVPGGTIKKG